MNYDADSNSNAREWQRNLSMPLEPIFVYVDRGSEKKTSDTGERVRFHGHRALAREMFAARQILLPSHAFAQADWINVNKALQHEVQRLFQLWACKQVYDIAVTNLRLYKCDNNHSPLCSSRLDAPESCDHILLCDEDDRVKCFQLLADTIYTPSCNCNRWEHVRCWKRISCGLQGLGMAKVDGLHCRRTGPDRAEAGSFTRSDWMTIFVQGVLRG